MEREGRERVEREFEGRERLEWEGRVGSGEGGRGGCVHWAVLVFRNTLRKAAFECYLANTR